MKPDSADESTKTPMGGTQAVARAAALLREIAAQKVVPCSLSALASNLGLERPTAYRILRRLVVEGLVTQDPATRGYALGPLLYELGLAAKPPLFLHSVATEALAHLAAESGDTVYAIVQSGMDSVCIDRQEGDYPVKALMMNPGRRRPMGIGSGSLSLLAAMPAEQANQMLRANTVRLRAAGEPRLNDLQQAVDQCRHDGYVVRAPKEAPEILSLAVSVLNAYGTPVLALSISALKFRIERRQKLLIGLLTKAKYSLEQQLQARSERAFGQTDKA